MAGIVGDVVAGYSGTRPLRDGHPGTLVVFDDVRQVSAGGGGEADPGVGVLLNGVAADLPGGVLVQVDRAGAVGDGVVDDGG